MFKLGFKQRWIHIQQNSFEYSLLIIKTHLLPNHWHQQHMIQLLFSFLIEKLATNKKKCLSDNRVLTILCVPYKVLLRVSDWNSWRHIFICVMYSNHMRSLHYGYMFIQSETRYFLDIKKHILRNNLLQILVFPIYFLMWPLQELHFINNLFYLYTKFFWYLWISPVISFFQCFNSWKYSVQWGMKLFLAYFLFLMVLNIVFQTNYCTNLSLFF